jgi:uncharacterized protein (DUF1697 family)
MTKYVALLRGIAPINPNMRNEKLRGVLEGLGFQNVQTVISSGNVLFESPSNNTKMLEETIEKAWPTRLGFTSTTIVRSQDELRRLVESSPFKGINDSPDSRLNVTFLKNKPKTDLKSPYQGQGYTVMGIGDRAVFTAIDLSGTKTPDVMRWLEKQFGKEITTRTWKTVHRILQKLNAD